MVHNKWMISLSKFHKQLTTLNFIDYKQLSYTQNVKLSHAGASFSNLQNFLLSFFSSAKNIFSQVDRLLHCHVIKYVVILCLIYMCVSLSFSSFCLVSCRLPCHFKKS